jgi:hypothetical protein
MSNGNCTAAPTFARLVGEATFDALTSATENQLSDEALFGVLVMHWMGRRGLRVVRAPDEIGPDDDTVELPRFELPLADRIRRAYDADDTLELERTAELPMPSMFMRRQAE